MTINISVFFLGGGGGERAKIFLPKSKYFIRYGFECLNEKKRMNLLLI